MNPYLPVTICQRGVAHRDDPTCGGIGTIIDDLEGGVADVGGPPPISAASDTDVSPDVPGSHQTVGRGGRAAMRDPGHAQRVVRTCNIGFRWGDDQQPGRTRGDGLARVLAQPVGLFGRPALERVEVVPGGEQDR